MVAASLRPGGSSSQEPAFIGFPLGTNIVFNSASSLHAVPSQKAPSFEPLGFHDLVFPEGTELYATPLNLVATCIMLLCTIEPVVL